MCKFTLKKGAVPMLGKNMGEVILDLVTLFISKVELKKRKEKQCK